MEFYPDNNNHDSSTNRNNIYNNNNNTFLFTSTFIAKYIEYSCFVNEDCDEIIVVQMVNHHWIIRIIGIPW